MKKIMSLLLTILLVYSANAKQTSTTVKGTVNNDKATAQAAATVLLQKAKDSALVKTEVTDGAGKYEFSDIKAGSYFVTITSVGYTQYTSAVITVAEGQTIEIPLATLKAAAKELAGVVVSGKKPMVEVKADKTIFNVESSINATGSNGMELLQKSPGVTVDKDDNISMKGKGGVRIYIDGRPSQMSNADLAAVLRSMNSTDIEAIEMISNPSAKFEASGTAGIINIRLKKDKRYGVNGTFGTGLAYGKTLKNNNSLSLNYRNKKTNWFGNYSNNFGKNESYTNLYRIQADSIFDQKAVQVSDRQNHNVKAGVDLFLNTKNTLGFIVTGNFGKGEMSSESNTPISAAKNGTIVRSLYATNLIPSNRKNLNLNSNYKFVDTSGHQLDIDLNYGIFRGRNNSIQPNRYFLPNGALQSEITYKNNTPTDIDILTLNIDYEQNFKKGKLGYGVKYSNVRTRNTFDFWDVVGGQDIKNLNRSNKFDYTENVNAAYVNYNRPLSTKYSLQAGLRAEQTISEGKLFSAVQQNDDVVKRNYLDFFPSAALTYTANQNNQLTATYSRRIQRPSYRDLNPFENKLDELTFQKGNAFLRPQYTNSFEINHLYKYKLSTTLGYSHIKDLFAELMDTTDKTKSFITSKNLASQDIVSLNIGTPFAFGKIWSGYANLSTNYSHYKANFGPGRDVNLDAFNYNLYVQNTFAIAKGLTGELSGWYSGPSVWAGTFKTKPMGSFDIGLQKLVLNDKGTLKLSLTDVAKTLHWNAISEFAGTYINGKGGYESRQLRLNFTYRFGKNTVKSARQRKAGSEEENKRINGSGGGLGGN